MEFLKKLTKIKGLGIEYLPCLTSPCIVKNEKHILVFFYLFELEIKLRNNKYGINK